MRRILIIEDEEYCATTLEIAFLTLRNLDVRWAATVAEALRVLQSDWSVSILVTDLGLPNMDGFELIARVRSDGRSSDLPIVVISGNPDPAVQERALRLGADAYFCKPYSTTVVCQQVERLLNLHARTASP